MNQTILAIYEHIQMNSSSVSSRIFVRTYLNLRRSQHLSPYFTAVQILENILGPRLKYWPICSVMEKFKLLHDFSLLTFSEYEWTADEEGHVCSTQVLCCITHDTLQYQASLTQDDYTTKRNKKIHNFIIV